MKPHDHIGWVFDGARQFDALAVPFLAEGAARGEQLMYVSADPEPGLAARLGDGLAPGTLQVASIVEVYGASGIVDAAAQRATFAAALTLTSPLTVSARTSPLTLVTLTSPEIDLMVTAASAGTAIT